MATKYFRLMATDGCPQFEPVSHWSGSWSGVAAVNDEVEQNRLLTRGCEEITKERYDELLKKKAQQQSQSDLFRTVADPTSVAQLVVRKAQQSGVEAKSDPAPPIEEVVKPVKLPGRRRSAAAAQPNTPSVESPAPVVA